jgi:hypothetical protein
MIYFIIIFILIVIIFYLLNNYVKNKIENFDNNQNIDIVIARYNEDLKWTLEKPFNQFKYIVYNKGNNEDFEKTNVKSIIKLPNVGKCDHTYLYHIINNYNNLADIVVFFPGSIDMSHKKKIGAKILEEIKKRNNAVFISFNQEDIQQSQYNLVMDNYITTYGKNKDVNPESELKKSDIRPFGKWFENKFGNIKVDCYIYYGIFSVHKNDILQNSIDKYKNLIGDLSDHSNPEVGHYFERSWCAIFHPMNTTDIIKYNVI